MKYCTKCGKQILDEAVICVHCGCALNTNFSNRNKEEEYTDALNQLENKIHTSNTWWKVIYRIQFTIATLLFIASIIVLIETEDTAIFAALLLSGGVFAGIGTFNFLMTQTSIKFLIKIKRNPTLIVEHFEPAGAIIANLILKILFGRILGIVGCVLDISTRNFVMNNRRIFKEIEKKHKKNTSEIVTNGSRGFSAGAIKLQ